MKTLSASAAAALARRRVLSVSPILEDHRALETIFHRPASVAPEGIRPHLIRVGSLVSARAALTRAEYAAVVCERDLRPGGWKDLLKSTQGQPNPPLLIVTSLLADEHLWAEALNLGAYDVLAKPFDRVEVVRVVNLACLRWHRSRRHGESSITVGAGAAASMM